MNQSVETQMEIVFPDVIITISVRHSLRAFILGNLPASSLGILQCSTEDEKINQAFHDLCTVDSKGR